MEGLRILKPFGERQTPQTVSQYVYWTYPLFEWCMAFAMCGMAVCIFLTPKTIEVGAFRFVEDAGFSSYVIFWIFAVVGVLRVAALISNGRWQGRWRYGTKARAIGTIAGAVIWFQLALALMLLTQVTGTLSIGIPMYLAITVGELISCYRIGFVYDRKLEILAETIDARLNLSQ